MHQLCASSDPSKSPARLDLVDLVENWQKAFRLRKLIKERSESIPASFPRDRILCILWFRSGLFAQLQKRRLKFCERAKQAVTLGRHADVLSEDPDKHIDWRHDAVHRRAWKEIRDLYQWWKKKRPARRSPLDDKKIAQPPLRFEKIAGTKFHRLVTPDKKKYAAYYQALKQHS